MTLPLALIIGFLPASFVMAGLRLAFRSEKTKQYVISDDPHRNITDKELVFRVGLNMLVSIGLILGTTFGFYDYLFYEGSAPLWRIALEFGAVVFIYDFIYYFVHRYPFHEWSILRGVHAVHHAAQYPRVLDSLLLHPLETAIGLGAFLGTIALVGGVSLWTFCALFFCYSALNLLNHAGIAIPFFPMKTLGVLAVKHDKHHHSMLSGNYASITPLPDMVFGTVE